MNGWIDKYVYIQVSRQVYIHVRFHIWKNFEAYYYRILR